MNDIPRYKASFPMQQQFVTNNDKCGDHIFTQIARKGNVAVYRRDRNDGSLVGYEVILIATIKAGTVFAKGAAPTTTDSESYPGSESFGKRAWFVADETSAMKRFEKIVKSQQAAAVASEAAQEEAEIPSGEFTFLTFASHNCMAPNDVAAKVLTNLIASKAVKVLRKGVYFKA